MALEQRHNAEARTFVSSGLSESAGLSRATQYLFQPIERAIANRQDLLLALDFGTGADLYGLPAYTGRRLSASALMADEVEQKLEAPKIKAPSDATAEAGVIAGKPNQETFGQANAIKHQNDIRPSDPSLVAAQDGETLEEFKARVAQIQANSFGFFGELTPEDMGRKTGTAQAATEKPATEQVLLASNITPNVRSLEQKQQYQDVKSDSEAPKIAQYSDGYMPPPTLVPSPEQLGITPETARALARAAAELILPWAKDHPLAERENDLMEQSVAGNPKAWEDAKGAFPQLARVSTNIMQAYSRNEIANYDRFDLKDDLDAATGKLTSAPGRPADQATLGISQISPKGIGEFERKYPQFKQFLESKGYTGPDHEIAALLDPECAPMIVAAKTASIVEDMQKHGIQKPTSEQIAYAYNPDVYSYSNGHGGKEYKSLYQAQIKLEQMLHPDLKKEYYATIPEVIENSAHVHNVMSKIK